MQTSSGRFKIIIPGYICYFLTDFAKFISDASQKKSCAVFSNKTSVLLQALSKIGTGIYIFSNNKIPNTIYCSGSYDQLNDIVLKMEQLYLKNDDNLTPLERMLHQHPSANEWDVKININVTKDDINLELAKAIINISLYPHGLNNELQLYTKSD